MAAIPFEVNEPLIGNQERVIDRLNTSLAPTASGHVRVSGNNFTWWGATSSAVQTAKRAGDEITLNIRPVQLSALDRLETGGGTAAVLARNAAGDYSLNRIAAGAETHVFSAVVPWKIETASYGAKLTKVVVAYELAVVDATSVDLRADSVVYAQGVNPVVTTNHGGAVVDADYDANHNTAAKRRDSTVVGGEHLMTLTLNTPAYYATANGLVRVEFTAVLANTGTLKVRMLAGVYTEKSQ